MFFLPDSLDLLFLAKKRFYSFVTWEIEFWGKVCL